MSALEELGTRTRQGSYQLNAPGTREDRYHQQDVGMSKRAVVTATFTAVDFKITGATNDFAAFVVGDTIVIELTDQGLNNGERIVTGVDATNAAYLVLNLPCKDEGPTAGVIVRTT